MDSKAISDAVKADMFQTLYGMTEEELKASKKTFGRPMMFNVVFVEQSGRVDQMVPMEIMAPLGKIKAKRKDWEAFLARTAERLSDAEHTYHAMTWDEECVFYDKMMEKAKNDHYAKLLAELPDDMKGQA